MSDSWDRLLWGVRFKSQTSAFLIGTVWAKERNNYPPHPCEPSRALLFLTRVRAREWCSLRNQENQARPVGDIVRGWRFTPVRVRETIRPVSE